MLTKLAEANLLPTIYQHFWSIRETPKDWGLISATPIYKKSNKENKGILHQVSLTLVPGNVIEIIFSEIPEHV